MTGNNERKSNIYIHLHYSVHIVVESEGKSQIVTLLSAVAGAVAVAI